MAVVGGVCAVVANEPVVMRRAEYAVVRNSRRCCQRAACMKIILRQAAVIVDPAANLMRIDIPRLRAERAGDRAAFLVRHPRGVEAEARALCGADFGRRDDAEHQRAGR